MTSFEKAGPRGAGSGRVTGHGKTGKVGYALLEGRAIAARYARPKRVGGNGYGPAFNDWLSDNRLYVLSSERTKLLPAPDRLRSSSSPP